MQYFAYNTKRYFLFTVKTAYKVKLFDYYIQICNSELNKWINQIPLKYVTLDIVKKYFPKNCKKKLRFLNILLRA